MVTVLPTVPLLGFTVTVGSKVKVVEAELAAPSVAVTVLTPVVKPVGTTKVVTKLPLGSIELVDTKVPAILMTTVEPAANPLPVTVTLVPVGPVTGDM